MTLPTHEFIRRFLLHPAEGLPPLRHFVFLANRTAKLARIRTVLKPQSQVGSLVRPGRPRYPVLVHQAAALAPRFLQTPPRDDALGFANPSPPSGWIGDFDLPAVDHARHIKLARRA
jgi:hypothetical protein